MPNYNCKTILNFMKKNILYKKYIKHISHKQALIVQRDKLFPGRIKWVDITNARYISRKPIYDFLVQNKNYITGNVLDFGCGSMQYKKMFDNIKNYYGLDVDGAQENGFYAEDVIYYDGIHIPFETEMFNSIISIEVLEHVEQLNTVMSELNRVLTGGGILFLQHL